MPGRMKGDTYTDLPYLEGWKPIPERAWALTFVSADGSEDYIGFKQAFKQRYPKIHMGPVDGWMPESVDYYLRHDPMGVRQDIDWELAAIPQTEEELAEKKRSRSNMLRKRRQDALAERGLGPKEEVGDAPAPLAATPRKPKGMSPEGRARMSQMMKDRHAAKKAAESAPTPAA